ncbi:MULTISPECIES: arginine/agmatine antiporter [Mesorhizobium]|uniref:Arginine/agmatine antiporter n=1 Tax=Rhizobium loti TaxID=381 RepID=A0A6M7U626_RHILI|nr:MULTISPECIES: arginine/agmatine antiporter [Mesorhizobium]KRB31908.1 arginine:agmatine antiporter [Mesorhizobium sp. Root172]OBQ72052.1 arginine:agmatine antiporter [Mesorhizobium loti]QKC72362.1 arginine/agmatine antiporter [Mesorhizobium loti]
MAEEAAAAPASGGGNKIGVVAATLMVAGNMMGSGVFMLPANLSAIGSIALIGWIFTIVGAVALALVFAKLAAIDPAAGGPYAYTRKAFGDYMGYQTNLIYWLANVIGNVALAVAGLGYLSHFFPVLKVPVVMAFAAIAVIWFFTYANILGPKLVGRLQSFTTVFALVPIFGMALFGWFWFSADIYESAWNVSGKSDTSAVMATLTFTLWAFIGVESASVSAGVVENPSRNVPIATVGGVVLASVAYILSSSVIMGMIPNKELLVSSAPFADAARLALGDFSGSVVALCAAVGCLGSLAGWTLLVGQSAKAAADDGLFPGIFARVNKRGVPSLGLVIVATIMSIQVLATMSPTASEQFGKIASIAVIMTLLPYIYSMIAIKVLGYRKMPHAQYTFFVITGLAGAAYCMVALAGSDGEQVRWSLIFVISTIVFYSASITRKRDIEEKHLHPGGRSPVWVRYLALGVTIAALAVMFWLSVGRYSGLDLHSRSASPPNVSETVDKMVPQETP